MSPVGHLSVSPGDSESRFARLPLSGASGCAFLAMTFFVISTVGRDLVFALNSGFIRFLTFVRNDKFLCHCEGALATVAVSERSESSMLCAYLLRRPPIGGLLAMTKFTSLHPFGALFLVPP